MVGAKSALRFPRVPEPLILVVTGRIASEAADIWVSCGENCGAADCGDALGDAGVKV